MPPFNFFILTKHYLHDNGQIPSNLFELFQRGTAKCQCILHHITNHNMAFTASKITSPGCNEIYISIRSLSRSSSLALRLLTLALCLSPSLCSSLKTCRLHATLSLLLFVDILASVTCFLKL